MPVPTPWPRPSAPGTGCSTPAQGYENEDAVGEGMRRSGVQRSELVLTTKLPDEQHGYDETLASFDRSVAALHLDTVDLYVIHWPLPEQDHS